MYVVLGYSNWVSVCFVVRNLHIYYTIRLTWYTIISKIVYILQLLSVIFFPACNCTNRVLHARSGRQISDKSEHAWHRFECTGTLPEVHIANRFADHLIELVHCLRQLHTEWLGYRDEDRSSHFSARYSAPLMYGTTPGRPKFWINCSTFNRCLLPGFKYQSY